MILDAIDLLNCLRCGRCRTVCPTLESAGWESMSPRGRIMLGLSYLEESEWIEGTEESLYTCTTCQACSNICPSDVEVDSIIESLRQAYLKDRVDNRRIDEMYEAISVFGNPMSDERSRRAWLEGVDGISLKNRSDIVYFVGCLPSYRSVDIAVSTLRILSDYGISLLDDERCCGSPLFRMGRDPPTFDSNIQQIEESGAEIILTSCAGCYKTLKNDYELECKVIHTAEFFHDNLDEIDPGKLDLTVTYHDPCHLGRGGGVIDEPRAVIERICDLSEMKRNRELSGCCGGGGGVRSGYHELSTSIAERRLDDLPPDADLIVTACPLCLINLTDSGGNVIDLSELIERSKK
ncbi:MAG: iron-sulfur binding protein [Candidatus Syntrophoarchaeum sp. GoM_oil]|nr:MAG: iron-sulfur binding protein [Candidatus Syntrophoarchaeum sp. GoM_oil]